MEALGALFSDLPDAISARLHEGWKADAEFELRSRALLRGWHEMTRAARDEAPLVDAIAAVGDPAWRRLSSESRDDLIAWQLIKSTWGRQHLAQAALGPCRAFERELRRALEERTGAWTLGDLAGATPRQLLDSAQKLPEDHRLRRVSARASEGHLLALRNRAAHPHETGFGLVDMKRLEDLLFHHDKGGEGLLGLVATFEFPGPKDSSA
jgi:hypothetical protein